MGRGNLMRRQMLVVASRFGQAWVRGAVIGFVVLLVSAVLFWYFEQGSPDVAHIGDGLLWVTRTLIQGEPPWDPTTGAGHALFYVVVITGVGIVAFLTGVIATRLMEVLMRKDAGLSETDWRGHLVVCGWSPEAAQVIRELHAEEVEDKIPVVILAELERNPLDDDLVSFVRGRATSAEDLRRAGIQHAETAIIVAEGGDRGLDPDDIDARTLLSALAVESAKPDIYTCVEVIRPQNRVHFGRAKVDEMIVSSELTGLLLAHSAREHGVSRVITELTSHEQGNELYPLPVDGQLTGKTFAEALAFLKERIDCIPVAIADEEGAYLVNPDASRVLEAGDRLLVIAAAPPAL